MRPPPSLPASAQPPASLRLPCRAAREHLGRCEDLARAPSRRARTTYVAAVACSCRRAPRPPCFRQPQGPWPEEDGGGPRRPPPRPGPPDRVGLRTARGCRGAASAICQCNQQYSPSPPTSLIQIAAPPWPHGVLALCTCHAPDTKYHIPSAMSHGQYQAASAYRPCRPTRTRRPANRSVLPADGGTQLLPLGLKASRPGQTAAALLPSASGGGPAPNVQRNAPLERSASTCSFTSHPQPTLQHSVPLTCSRGGMPDRATRQDSPNSVGGPAVCLSCASARCPAPSAQCPAGPHCPHPRGWSTDRRPSTHVLHSSRPL